MLKYCQTKNVKKENCLSQLCSLTFLDKAYLYFLLLKQRIVKHSGESDIFNEKEGEYIAFRRFPCDP